MGRIPASVTDDKKLLKILQAQCDKTGSVGRWCKQTGIATADVYNALSGKAKIRPYLAAALGYKRQSGWVKVNKQK
jgi:hypothetical protein